MRQSFHSCKQGGKGQSYFAVGYKVDGLVPYYLILSTLGDPTTYQLAIAVPKKATRSGRLTRREYAMSKKLQFVCLL